MNLFNLLDKTVSFGEKASDGFFTFLIGMVVIFGGMTVLILCVTAFGKLASYVANKTEKKSEEKVEAKNEAVLEDGVPEEIRVAIIAAVAAYYAESRSKNEFTVKKIKKL